MDAFVLLRLNPIMNLTPFCLAGSLLLVGLLPVSGVGAEGARTIQLWPKGAPGETATVGEEKDLTKPGDELVAGQRLIRLGNVSEPTLTLFPPPVDKDTGAAVVVCPGGGYHILAMDLEGTEVCEWLNSIGVTGVLLKYRVPKRAGDEAHLLPLQDAQRALGWVRHHAVEFGIDPKRIGVLGFSAGGHLAAAASNNWRERAYDVSDGADEASCRPDFSILVYPAYLTVKDEGDKLAPQMKVTTNTPPTFVVISQDDPVRVETALFYSLALKNAKVPAELHVYPTGGHGYGLRRTKEPVTYWPELVSAWMKSGGWLERRSSP